MEVRGYRCCMCPQRENSSQICPTGPGKTKETVCDFVITWSDSCGWKYRIMSSPSGRFKGHYLDDKHDGDDGWKGMRQMVLRESFDEAQEDLNQYAKKKGWLPIDSHILNLTESKKAICDWIMGMTVKEYFDFMGIVLENTQIPVIQTITEEMFYSCRQCDKEHGEECEKIGIDDLSKCYRFFCEHYGVKKGEKNEE